MRKYLRPPEAHHHDHHKIVWAVIVIAVLSAIVTIVLIFAPELVFGPSGISAPVSGFSIPGVQGTTPSTNPFEGAGSEENPFEVSNPFAYDNPFR